MRTNLRRAGHLLLAMTCLLAAIAGCGGNQAGTPVATGATGDGQTAARGTLSIRVLWPEQAEDGTSRSAKLIPTLAQSIRVWLERAGQPVEGASTVINKGPGTLLGQITCPVGSYILKASALDQRDGVGTVLAGNAQPLTVVAGPNADVKLALASAIASFDIVPSTSEPAFGDRVDLTGVAKDSGGNAVLLPVDSSVQWTVAGDLRRPAPKSRAVATPQYSEHAIARRKGNGQVSCTFVEGQTIDANGNAQNVTRTVTKDLPVQGWRPVTLNPGEEEAGPRRVGYDPLYAVGRGWSSGGNGEVPKQMPPPVEDGFSLSKIQAGAETTKKGGWSSSEVKTSTGQTVDARLSARYLAYSGSVSTSMSTSMSSESNNLQLDYTIIKDFGEYWIDRDSVQLTPEACDLLYNDPETFKDIYGDQVVIGQQLAHIVHVKFSFSSYSTKTNEDFGMSLDASGNWGTGGVDFSGRMSSFLESQKTEKGASCTVTTTIGDVPGLSAASNTLNDSTSISNLFAALDTAFTMVANSSISSGPDGAKAIGFTVAPISYLVPAVPTIETPGGDRLTEYMKAWIAQTRALKKLDEIVLGGATGPGGHFYWDGKAGGGELWQRLVNARTAIRNNVDTVLVPGIKKIIGDPVAGIPGDETVPPLTDAQRAPFMNWPRPRVEAVFATWTQHHPTTPDYIRVYDYFRVYDAPGINAPGGSDTPFWVDTATGGGWTPPASLGGSRDGSRQLADGTWEFFFRLEWAFHKPIYGDYQTGRYAFAKNGLDPIALKGSFHRAEDNTLHGGAWPPW